jgi:hypothetical protein
MFRSRSLHVVLFALPILGSTTLRAQRQCPADVPVDPDNPYSYRLRTNRCEGACGRPRSNSTHLRIVGFSRGVPFRAGTPNFAVRWADLPDNAAILEVSAVTGPYCYRMDKVLSGGSTSFTWSSTLATEIGVKPADLAAMIRIAHSAPDQPDSMLVPVGPSIVRSGTETLMVQLMPGREFDEIVFSLTALDDGRLIISNQSLGQPYYPEGRVIPFALPRSVPAGVPLRLRIVGRYGSNGRYERGSNSTSVVLWIPR